MLILRERSFCLRTRIDSPCSHPQLEPVARRVRQVLPRPATIVASRSFDSTGKFLRQWQTASGVSGLFLTKEQRLWAGSTLYDLDGRIASHLPQGDPGAHGIAVSTSAEVYLGILSGKVQKFVPLRIDVQGLDERRNVRMTLLPFQIISRGCGFGGSGCNRSDVPVNGRIVLGTRQHARHIEKIIVKPYTGKPHIPFERGFMETG